MARRGTFWEMLNDPEPAPSMRDRLSAVGVFLLTAACVVLVLVGLYFFHAVLSGEAFTTSDDRPPSRVEREAPDCDYDSARVC